jgi:hypothetical protein
MHWRMAIPVAGFVVIGVVNPTAAPQQSPGTEAIRRTLERMPERDRFIPTDIAMLVKLSHAAVVGKIAGFGELISLNDMSPTGKRIGTDVFASYEVYVSEVLFNKRTLDAPPLSINKSETITQPVSKSEAEAFVDHHGPAVVGSEYLIFLWYRPGASSWSMFEWPLQFRKSVTVPGGAEPAAAYSNGFIVSRREWLGLSVPVVATAKDSVVPQWPAMLAEVKRLSTNQVTPR